jgi:hypothetical protein
MLSCSKIKWSHGMAVCVIAWFIMLNGSNVLAAPKPAPSKPPKVIEEVYEPVAKEVCAILQEDAAAALKKTTKTAVKFTLEAITPFTDPITGETGQGCTLKTTGTGVTFKTPAAVVNALLKGFVGFTENPDYRASGPAGESAAMTRDMALMLISVEWTPAPEAKCPQDKPISACKLTPKQKLYTIRIQTAQK